MNFTHDFVKTGMAGKVLAMIEFTPVSVDYVDYGSRLSYEGYSKHFEEVDKHQISTKYEISTTANSDGDLLNAICTAVQ